MKSGYDPEAFIARLAEIVCHDNFTEMHAFEHHQSIVEEYNATREPWRWMHLVCGAQAAAISFGKTWRSTRSISNSSTPRSLGVEPTGRPCASLFRYHLTARGRACHLPKYPF